MGHENVKASIARCNSLQKAGKVLENGLASIYLRVTVFKRWAQVKKMS